MFPFLLEKDPASGVYYEITNLDLSVLLAYQLRQNWHGRINLCMVIQDVATRPRAEQFLHELIMLARLPGDTAVILREGQFEDILTETPPGDLNIFGLQKKANLSFY